MDTVTGKMHLLSGDLRSAIVRFISRESKGNYGSYGVLINRMGLCFLGLHDWLRPTPNIDTSSTGTGCQGWLLLSVLCLEHGVFRYLEMFSIKIMKMPQLRASQHGTNVNT